MKNPYEGPTIAEPEAAEFRCPNCHTDLSRTSCRRCPACGVHFDAATLSRHQKVRVSRASWPPSTARIALVFAGVSLLPFVWLSTFAVQHGTPQWWSPVPLIFFVPVWLNPISGLVLCAGVVLGSFAAFSWPLVDGRPRLLAWSLGATLLLQTFNWIYLALAYRQGLELDATHTNAVCGINLALSISILGSAIMTKTRPHFLWALSTQWLAWFWFAMYSFPLLCDLEGGV